MGSGEAIVHQDVEKGRQLRSRVAPRLNVPKNVRLARSLAAALPDGLFDHPEERIVVILILGHDIDT
jgi:hypothetical protein